MLGTFCVGNYIPWLTFIDRLRVEDHLNKKTTGEETQDFVDILRDIQKDKTIGFTLNTNTLKAVILDVFVAGSDTIFSSLDWAMS
ncbi:putative indoleacetaldoxime dehydratase [Helianthus anomalus]